MTGALGSSSPTRRARPRRSRARRAHRHLRRDQGPGRGAGARGHGAGAAPGWAAGCAHGAETSRDVREVELKYRVATWRPPIGSSAGRLAGLTAAGSRARAMQLEDRRRHVRWRLDARGSRTAPSARRTRPSSVKALAHGTGRAAPSPRGARGTGRPRRRAGRLAGVRRALAGPRARRRRAIRRAGDDPPASSQARVQARSTRGRAEPRRGRCGPSRPGSAHLRRLEAEYQGRRRRATRRRDRTQSGLGRSHGKLEAADRAIGRSEGFAEAAPVSASTPDWVGPRLSSSP